MRYMATSAEIHALADKYAVLAALKDAYEKRRAQGQEGGPETRAAMKTLAARFPGCLRELESFDSRYLANRGDACRFVAETPTLPGHPNDIFFEAVPWLFPVSFFHRRMADLLAVKAWLQGVHEPAAADLARFLAALPALEVEAPEDFASLPDLRLTARPPEGRLSAIVWRELEMATRASQADLAFMMFGTPNPGDGEP